MLVNFDHRTQLDDTGVIVPQVFDWRIDVLLLQIFSNKVKLMGENHADVSEKASWVLSPPLFIFATFFISILSPPPTSPPGENLSTVI